MTPTHKSEVCKKLFRLMLRLFLLIALCPQTQVLADQVLLIDELNPKTTNLGLFNSFKFHSLIIAITQKNVPPFDCHSNRYIFYNYEKENYFELFGGNLKVNSNYSKLIVSRILTSVELDGNQELDRKPKLETIVSKLNISLQTAIQGKSTSTDQSISCWQQPEIFDLTTKSRHPTPFLLANLCKHSWCSELFWTDINHINLWVQNDPKEFHKIQLNTQTGAYKYLDKSPKFLKKEFMQLNVPRDNLISQKNLNSGTFTLRSHSKDHISVLWKTRRNNNIRIELIRAATNKKAGENIRKDIVQLISQKKYSETFRLFNFGFWLSPDDIELKFEKLRVYALLLLLDNFFKSLNDDFTKKERFYVCKKLHVDSAIKNLWEISDFKEKFKKSCL